jgi:hypothetical protein
LQTEVREFFDKILCRSEGFGLGAAYTLHPVYGYPTGATSLPGCPASERNGKVSDFPENFARPFP